MLWKYIYDIPQIMEQNVDLFCDVCFVCHKIALTDFTNVQNGNKFCDCKNMYKRIILSMRYSKCCLEMTKE